MTYILGMLFRAYGRRPTIMKNMLTTFLVVLSIIVHGQDFQNANLQAMVDAERAFIQLAKEKNARDAFHTFLSEHAVTFQEEPKIGLKHFETGILNTSLLSWQPEFCDIAASGDFGYMTGPWELRTLREDKEPESSGHFLTVWSKQHDGQWKAVLDIGISHGENRDTVVLKTSLIKPVKLRRGDFHAVTEVEEKFISNYEELGSKAYDKVRSEEIRIYRTGKQPIITAPDVAEYIKVETSDIDYLVMGGAISKSKDLAYVYGTATIKNSKDLHIVSGTANYVRIWKKEDGDHWKIVVDILSQG